MSAAIPEALQLELFAAIAACDRIAADYYASEEFRARLRAERDDRAADERRAEHFNPETY